MKRSEFFFNLSLLPLDVAALFLASVASYYTRIHAVNFVGPVLFKLQIVPLLIAVIAVIPVVILIFALLGLYNQRGTRRFFKEFSRVVLGVSTSLFIVMLVFFFNANIFPSRFIILATWGFGILFVTIGRSLLKILQKYLLKKGIGNHRLVVVSSNGPSISNIEHELSGKKYGFLEIAHLNWDDQTLTRLEDLYKNTSIDEIIHVNPDISDQINLKLLEFSKSKGLEFSFVPNLFDVQRNVVDILDIGGLPIISIKNTPLDGWGRVAKRIIDIIASICALIILSPVFVIIYIAIKLDSQGPVIYPALRAGKGKDFWFYKFRSMYTHLSVGLGGEEAEKIRQQLWEKNDRGGKESPFLKIKNDPRVTKVGKWLRKTKLDEIPQFWNVLKGDMSLVGPRAHVLDEVAKYKDRYSRMFSIKPGIFGVSQIAQTTVPDLPFEEEIRLNTYYIENWSLWLDIKVLFKSAYLIVFGERSNSDY